MKNGFYSFQCPPLWLQNSWLTFPQSSSDNRPQKELFFPPLSNLPQGHRRPVWPGVPAPFCLKMSLKEGIYNSCLYLEWGMRAKKEKDGVLLMLLTLFSPFPCLSSLECPCDNCVSIQSAAAAPQCFHSPANSFRLCFLQT